MIKNAVYNWRIWVLAALGTAGSAGLGVDADATLYGLGFAGICLGAFIVLLQRWMSAGRFQWLTQLIRNVE